MLKNRNVLTAVSVFFMCAVASVAYADFAPTIWKYYKDIGGVDQRNADSSVVKAVELDNEVFSNARPDLADLRVIDGTENETPYVLRSEGATAKIATYHPRVLNLSSVPGSHTSFVADFGSNTPHNSIDIITSSSNFRKKVEVSGSNDATEWQILDNKQVIYDYTLEFRAKNTKITYPESTFRYLKIKILDAGDAPINVSGVVAQKTEEKGATRVSYKPSFTIQEENKITKIVIDLGQRGLETDTILLGIDSENFERFVSIQGSDNAVSWNVVGNDVLYSYKTSKLDARKNIIKYANTKKQYLLLQIQNYDNKPLMINGVKAEGLARSLLFLAEQGMSYRLYYGANDARSPVYDLGSVIKRFDENEINVTSLGRQKDNERYTPPMPPPPPVIPFSERFPWLLPSVLTLVSFSLIFLVYKVFKKTSSDDTMRDN